MAGIFAHMSRIEADAGQGFDNLLTTIIRDAVSEMQDYFAANATGQYRTRPLTDKRRAVLLRRCYTAWGYLTSKQCTTSLTTLGYKPFTFLDGVERALRDILAEDYTATLPIITGEFYLGPPSATPPPPPRLPTLKIITFERWRDGTNTVRRVLPPHQHHKLVPDDPVIIVDTGLAVIRVTANAYATHICRYRPALEAALSRTARQPITVRVQVMRVLPDTPPLMPYYLDIPTIPRKRDVTLPKKKVACDWWQLRLEDVA